MTTELTMAEGFAAAMDDGGLPDPAPERLAVPKARQLWRIQHERKAELLEIAERLGAPELSRKAGTQLT